MRRKVMKGTDLMRGSLSKQDVLNTLRNRILYLEYTPGTQILDTEIAQELSVSRTPVREALLLLKDEKLVNIFPQSGTIVAPIDMNMTREINYMRHILESDVFMSLCGNAECIKATSHAMALQELAVKEGNPRDYVLNDHLFHYNLFHLAGHGLAWQSFEKIYRYTIRFHVLDFFHSKDVFKTSLKEHQEIIDCMARGDRRGLTDVLVEHHDIHLRTSGLLMENYPDYFLQTE